MTLNQYEHKTLQEINSNYIKDLFRFFSYEYTQMYKDTYRIKEGRICLWRTLEKQIENRLHTTGLIHNWKITIDGPTLSEVRDTTIHNILSSSDDNKRHPIKIIFMFSQSKGMEIEMCQFIIE